MGVAGNMACTRSEMVPLFYHGFKRDFVFGRTVSDIRQGRAVDYHPGGVTDGQVDCLGVDGGSVFKKIPFTMASLSTACSMARRTARSRVAPRLLFMARARVAKGWETRCSLILQGFKRKMPRNAVVRLGPDAFVAFDF